MRRIRSAGEAGHASSSASQSRDRARPGPRSLYTINSLEILGIIYLAIASLETARADRESGRQLHQRERDNGH